MTTTGRVTISLPAGTLGAVEQERLRDVETALRLGPGMDGGS